MNSNYLSIQTEISQLQQIIAELDDEAVIERIGYEHRLSELEHKLQSFTATKKTKHLTLTFRGEPVLGSQAIKAGFASKAIDLFSDAYDMIVAALSVNLNEAVPGSAPDKEKHKLLISGTAVGSFGFQFKLPESESDSLDEEQMADVAIKRIEKIFKVAAEEGDEDIADIIDAVPPRAVKKIYSFLEQLEKNKAWCGISFEGSKFQFKSLEQLRHAARQLKEDNIIESEVTFVGELSGFLPDARTFEFLTRVSASEETKVIKGKVNTEFKLAENMNKDWLNKQAKISCKKVIVGKGKPRYILNEIVAC